MNKIKCKKKQKKYKNIFTMISMNEFSMRKLQLSNLLCNEILVYLIIIDIISERESVNSAAGH